MSVITHQCVDKGSSMPLRDGIAEKKKRLFLVYWRPHLMMMMNE